MPDVVMRARGSGGYVELLTDRVRVTRQGLLAFLIYGFTRHRELLLADISSIEFKDVGTTNGHIKFVCRGGGQVALAFTAVHAEQFNKLMTQIETLTGQSSSTPAPSVWDDIERLGALHARGMVSDEEFTLKREELLAAAGARPARVPFTVATTREMPSTNGKHASGWLHHIPANLSHRATIVGIVFGIVYVASMVVLSDRGGAPATGQASTIDGPALDGGRNDRMGFAHDLQQRMDSVAAGVRATVSGPDGTTLHYEIPAARHFIVDEWAAGIVQQGGLLEIETLERLGFEQFIVSDSTGELGRWTVAQFASFDGS